jgi:hypothetical protein
MPRSKYFNYLTFLRELEREVAAGANQKLPEDRDGLLDFATGQMRHQEKLTLASIHKLTERQDTYDFDHPPSWPPVVSTGQLVSRFVGHAIGKLYSGKGAGGQPARFLAIADWADHDAGQKEADRLNAALVAE